jgi:diguanylate cyclase (GGDEF)-like protein
LDLVDKRTAQFQSGEFDPFTGPIKDQKGKLRLPAGLRADPSGIPRYLPLARLQEGRIYNCKMETVLKLQINVFCILVIAILWSTTERRKVSRGGPDTVTYKCLLASTAVLLFLDSASWLLDGVQGGFARASSLAVNILYYAFHSLPTVSFILYTDFQITRNGARSKRILRPLVAIAAAAAAIAVASPFFDIFFIVDDRNRYHRGSGFLLFAAIQYGLVAYALFFIVCNRRKVNRRVLFTLLAYPLPTLAAAAIQNLFFGLILLWPVMTLFLLITAFNIENRRAKTDYLTGTANRRSLDEELERRIETLRPGRNLCGLMIDVDDFKSINDLFGHEAGDRALEDVASILQSSVRVDDMVARMGGDEFVILADLEFSASIEAVVKRIENAVKKRNASKARPYTIALSIGRSVYDPSKGEKAPAFLALLDAAMYETKKNRKSAAKKPYYSPQSSR